MNMKKIFFIVLFSSSVSLGFSQMTKDAVEYELAKYTKNTCYRFSIATLGGLKSLDHMVDETFELKLGETVLTIKNEGKYFTVPYASIQLIESSVESSKKEGKFIIYLK